MTLQAYRDAVEMQSIGDLRVTRAEMSRAFADTVVKPVVRDQVGAAMNSGRAIFMYGPAGSGKTYLVRDRYGVKPEPFVMYLWEDL